MSSSAARNRKLQKTKPNAASAGASAAAAPKLVPVKQEPATGDVKDSLAYLIEDRVGLVKQIFQLLDSKTVKAMAPDFLAGQSAESLQEYCLDELLGISNKRLLSVIDETKCPTDTEDSDSDVEKIEGACDGRTGCRRISVTFFPLGSQSTFPWRKSPRIRRTRFVRLGRGHRAKPSMPKVSRPDSRKQLCLFKSIVSNRPQMAEKVPAAAAKPSRPLLPPAEPPAVRAANSR